MKLEWIGIKNFKGLRDQSLEISNFGCLVGENNAGKSSVLQAIVYALNRPSQLPSSLFYDNAAPVEFRLRFSGIDEGHLARLAEEHRAKIAGIVFDQTFNLIVTYRVNEKVEITVGSLVPREPRFRPEAISATFEGKRGAAAIREVMQLTYPEVALPDGVATISAAKQLLSQHVAAFARDAFELQDVPLPSGISSSIVALLPEPIYIPAVKNLSDDLKTNQSTSFGRLLALLLDDLTPDLEQINASLVALNALLNRVTENGTAVDRRHEKVRSLEALVEQLLGENFPRAKVELHIPPPELKAILSTAQIYVDDGSRDLIENKGDGIKRSLTFALLQAYVHQLERQADQVQEVAQRPLLFLFEEPELYLHPKSQRTLFNTLARISHSHQVLVTTHSPLFFAPGVTAVFVRVAKVDAQPKPVGVLNRVNFSLDAKRADAFRMTRFENCDAAFFSRRVVLFEGESDDSYCRHISVLMNPEWDFEKQNISLVRVSGKGNFARFRDFFEAFGIGVKIVADLDALFDGYQHLGASTDLNEIRSRALREIDARIVAAGIRAEPASRQVKDKVHQQTFKDKYEAAKRIVRAIQGGASVTAEMTQALDGLFTWEQEIARVRACRDDPDSAAAIVPLLDALRLQGVCVLSAGAIEDYYPNGTPDCGSKPERALLACSRVTTGQQASALSKPLMPGRPPELHEVFAQLFA